MLHAFGHHVARWCMMLDDVERSLMSINIIQHFFCVNKNVTFVGSPCSTARMPAKLTLRVSVTMAMIHCLYLLRALAFRVDAKIRYGE